MLIRAKQCQRKEQIGHRRVTNTPPNVFFLTMTRMNNTHTHTKRKNKQANKEGEGDFNTSLYTVFSLSI